MILEYNKVVSCITKVLAACSQVNGAVSYETWANKRLQMLLL